MTLLLLPLEVSVDLVAEATLSLLFRMSVIDLSCLSGISTVSVSAWGSGRAWPGLGPAWGPAEETTLSRNVELCYNSRSV